MAFLPKKNVKWSIEALPVSEYTKLQKVVTAKTSVARSQNFLPTSSAMSTSATTRPGFTSLPSLAPLSGQEISEVSVLTTLPQQTNVDMNTVFGQREQDRKARREIANSNERRRMQSINAGFKSLKAILPQISGEKLSKAAILQQTADYIFQLDSEKSKLFTLNEKFRSALSECKCDNPKRIALMKVLINDEKDEGIGSPRDDEYEDSGRENIEIRLQLDKERRQNTILQEKIRELEAKLRLALTTPSSSNPHSSIISTTPQVLPLPHVVKHESTNNSNSFTNQPLLPPTYVPNFSQPLPRPSLTTVDTSCATIDNTLVSSCVETSMTQVSSRVEVQNKSTANLPRSSQPLKKRSIGSVESDNPKNKMAKLHSNQQPASTMNTVAARPVVCNTSQGAVLLQHSGNPVIAVADGPRPIVSVTLQQSDSVNVPHGVLSNGQPINLTEPPILLSTPANPPTYFTLSPPFTWPESQVNTNSPNYSFAIKPSNPAPLSLPSHYVIQSAPTVAQNHPEEITLNQLNAVPSLTKTLSQINPIPAVNRLNSNDQLAGGAVSIATRVLTDLSVVAMDSVLNQQVKRRLSNATTDSAPSDEESKGLEDQVAMNCTKLSVAAATSRRTKSDPGYSQLELNRKEVNLSNSYPAVPVSAPVPVITHGPGSPLYRRIDTAATRRNLETIVQAIDHLEQQERRNSQDRQANN